MTSVNNLYTRYDEDGTAHHFINDDEVDKDVWLQQHPHLRKGRNNGRDSDGGRGGRSTPSESAGAADAKEQVRQGIRNLRQTAKAERSRGSGDELGQSGQRPEQT